MPISMKLLLEELKYDYKCFYDIKNNPTFECANLLTAEWLELSGDKLFVSLLSEVINLPVRKEGNYFLCLNDQKTEYSEPTEARRNIIVIQENVQLNELFNDVQQVFLRINKWIMDMQISVMQNRGLQEIMTLSEQIIGNHISVMDDTFKLMAFTKNILTDDPVTNDLVKHGYHPEKTVKRFQLTRRIEQFERADDIIVNAVSTMSSYSIVLKVYKFMDTYSFLVVMVCCKRGISDGLLDLFRMMLEYIRIYIEREYFQQGGLSTSNSLVCDLLDKNIADIEEAKCRASYASIPFYGYFDLFKLVFQDDINTPISRVIRKLTMLMPKSKVLLYRRNVLVLNEYNGNETEPDSEVRLEIIWNAMEGQLSCCGISNCFDSLWGLRTAYEQACEAIKIGNLLQKKGQYDMTYGEGKNNFRFEKLYLHYMMEYCLSGAPELFKKSFVFKAIRRLQNYGEKHNTECIKLLHTYLLCERKATEASVLLHMHRNTVLYHIGKIEEMLGVKLDDPEIRLKLLLALKATPFLDN